MPSSSGSSSGDLESKLRDANWRLQRLQTEYDHAVARLNAQKDSSKKMDDDVDVNVCHINSLYFMIYNLFSFYAVLCTEGSRFTPSIGGSSS